MLYITATRVSGLNSPESPHLYGALRRTPYTMPDFVHLHCHTEYSLLDGAIRIRDLCRKAKDFGLPAAAVTDHGNLYGAMHFYLEAKKVGIKPIIGCEVYVCDNHTDKTPEKRRDRHHLVLLAQNREGYHNLVRLVSHGALFGFYDKPRVDKNLLRQYSGGIIALSACIGGEIPKKLRKQGFEAALEAAKEYAAIYPGRFYLELQSNGLKEQVEANAGLLRIAEQTGLPLVATNDCHYLNADDVDAHDVLLCIQTQAQVDDPNRMRFETRELYYKSPEEMERDFADVPEAVANAGRIAEMVEDYDFDLKTPHFPCYELPEGMTLDEEFRRLAREGLVRRLEKMPPDTNRKLYEERLEHELEVICDMGFPGYFLIVQDFINWAKNNGVPVGPGRGSAAGSLVAYALRITNLDPIPYNLLFERFLNSERVSLPDIDVDFCEANRHRVIDYMVRKYGADSVSQITTFGKMLAKGVVRDVGRAMGMSFQETDRIAKLIPADLKMTVKKALELEPDLAEMYKKEPRIKSLLDTSMRLEGLSRHASIHAAGLVVSDKPMQEYLPLYRGKQENDIVTQFDMKMVEKIGLVKFDFLGLRNMTVIADALALIEQSGKTPPDLDFLPFNDQATYRLYSAGDTDGIFQVESSGMRRYLRRLKPSVFEDIIAMLALYRPGPLKSGMVDEFIKRKQGVVPVEYPLESLRDCLKDTYGVIVYQEQVMQIARVVAGYSLGGADLLRRAMGKKDPEAMAKERSKFVEGALERGVDRKKADEIFDLMEKFAEYGFNKSHSAAYALISYHTAYLKAHYKTEFMAALLSSEMGNQDKLLKYIASCGDMGIAVLAPSVNDSDWTFGVKDGAVIFGLGGIKNVGREAVREMVESRKKDGPFVSLLDLCRRINSRKMTKRALESLIKAGACDCLGVSRAGLFAALDAVVARAQKMAKMEDSNQISLFSLVPEEARPQSPGIGFDCPEGSIPEWDSGLLSKHEKEAFGFFFKNHPLMPHIKEIQRLGLLPLEECRELPTNATVKCAVLLTEVTTRFNAKGERWALCAGEDLTAKGTLFFFSKAFEAHRELIQPDLPLVVFGRVKKDQDAVEGDDADDAPPPEIKILCDRVMTLEEVSESHTGAVCIEPPVEPELTPDRLKALKELLRRHPGRAPVQLHLNLGGFWCRLQLPETCRVRPGAAFERDLADWSSAAASA